jgi:hypothetical protein
MDLMKRLSDGLISRRPGRTVKREFQPFFAEDGLGSLLPLASNTTEVFSKCVAEAVAELLDERITNHPFTYLQFGLSEMTSLALADDVLRTAGVTDARIVGFDSSKGLVEGELGVATCGSDLRPAKPSVISCCVAFDDVDLVQGSFPDTLTPATRSRLNLDRADLIVIDSDSFSAARLALQFSLPLVGDRAFVVFGHGRRNDDGECAQTEAFEEVLGEHTRFVAEPRPSPLAPARVFYLTHCSLL